MNKLSTKQGYSWAKQLVDRTAAYLRRVVELVSREQDGAFSSSTQFVCLCLSWQFWDRPVFERRLANAALVFERRLANAALVEGDSDSGGTAATRDRDPSTRLDSDHSNR